MRRIKSVLNFTLFTALLFTGCKVRNFGTAERIFRITVEEPEHGLITVKKGSAELTEAQLKAVAENTELTVILTAKPGHRTVKLAAGAEEVSESPDGGRTLSTPVKVSKDITVRGETEELFAVSVTQPAHGSITVKSGKSVLTPEQLKAVAENTELTVTLIADAGYKAVKLTVGAEEVSKSEDGGKTIVKDVTVTKAATVSGETEKLIVTGEKEALNAEGVSFNMVYIAEVKDGTVGADHQNNNKPRKVNLSAYQISETEVTQELYQAVTGENPSYFLENKKVTGEIQRLRPAEQVKWVEAAWFCNRLTEKVLGGTDACVYYADEQLQTLYTKENADKNELPYADWSKKGFRLPTEAEWEYAAMGGNSGKYAGSDNIGEVAWYRGNAVQVDGDYVTRQTATKKANGYGIFDMSGNVYEWCWDWATDSTPEGGDNPKGALNGSQKAERGGNYGIYESKCESSWRDYDRPNLRYKFVGVRFVRTL